MAWTGGRGGAGRPRGARAKNVEARSLAELRKQLNALEQESARGAKSIAEAAQWQVLMPLAPAAFAALKVPSFTVETRMRGNFSMLGKPGRPVHNLGANANWTSWAVKPQLYYEHLAKLAERQPHRIVILADGMDVINGGCTEEQLLEAYGRTVGASGGAPVVFGAEHCCFPWRPHCEWYQNFTHRRDAVLAAHGMVERPYEAFADCKRCRDLNEPLLDAHCSSPPMYQHLNSGFIMGPTVSVLAALTMWLNRYTAEKGTDQLQAHKVLFERPDLVTLDYAGGLVLNVGELAESTLGGLLEVRDGVLHNLATQRRQCFVHGAGRGKHLLLKVLVQLLLR